MRKVFAVAAWGLAGLIVVFTLGPIGDRPQFGHPQMERFLAFFALAMAWCYAHPGRRLWVAVSLIGAAVLLEVGQGFAPGRDPGAPDVVAKIAGVLAGAAFAAVLQAVADRARPSLRV